MNIWAFSKQIALIMSTGKSQEVKLNDSEFITLTHPYRLHDSDNWMKVLYLPLPSKLFIRIQLSSLIISNQHLSRF
jgi:hypothetical protein